MLLLFIHLAVANMNDTQTEAKYTRCMLFVYFVAHIPYSTHQNTLLSTCFAYNMYNEKAK